MPPNIALIGCGAIAQAFYLPALLQHRTKFGNLWLVDPSDHVLSNAASILSGERAHRLVDVKDELDLAIVAAPNALHFPLALEALGRNAHILLEKPFVIYPEEGRKLTAAAAAANRIIAINQTRRHAPITQALRKRIRTGEFGRLKSIVHREGTKLVWPFESGAAFAHHSQRTGTIMDFGVHVIDFYHYLLGPQWTLVSAIHDGFSGPEGLAEIELRADESPVSIRLSRYHSQENIARMAFERADISFSVYDTKAYFLRSAAGKVTSVAAEAGSSTAKSAADSVLLNFMAASEGREPAICDAASSMPVIDILDQIYRLAQHYPAMLGNV